MNVLLIYPEYPDTFWSFKHVLRIVARKAAFPPLGLLTVAGMLPKEWDKRLVDMNIDPCTDEQLRWADYVFISAMLIQQNGTREVLDRCRQFDVTVVAGGPLFSARPELFADMVDHQVLNEAELTLPILLEDLAAGCAKPVYRSDEKPDIGTAPLPLWDLIDMKRYVSMPVQYSRGCPHDCEFCDIIIMNGRVPRTKDSAQFLGELDALYERKWRGHVFVVDDNFVGNKRRLRSMLPKLIEWMQRHNYPFALCTEASLDLADDDELLHMMAEAGFNQVFCGIETPVEESLVACHKYQNAGRDMAASVKKIQNAGLAVMGGFIVGFDSDPPNIFRRQLDFIQKTGIVTAMIGLLQALPGTRLYKRLHKEDRLIEAPTGDNVDCTINFVPRMDKDKLIRGYRRLLQMAYSPSNFYKRIVRLLEEYRPSKHKRMHVSDLVTFLRSIWYLGVRGKDRWRYWRLLLGSLVRYPRGIGCAVTQAIFGHHLELMVKNVIESSSQADHLLPARVPSTVGY